MGGRISWRLGGFARKLLNAESRRRRDAERIALGRTKSPLPAVGEGQGEEGAYVAIRQPAHLTPEAVGHVTSVTASAWGDALHACRRRQ